MLNFGHTIKSHKLELKLKTDIKIKSYFTIQVVRQSYVCPTFHILIHFPGRNM